MTKPDPVAKSRRITELVASMFMGLNLTRVASSEASSRALRFIQVKDINDGVITYPDTLEIANVDPKRVGRQELQVGDVLVSARGTLLKCAVVSEKHVGCVASANFIIIRPGPKSQIESELLCAFLRQAETHAFLLSRISGTAQPVLTLRDLESLTLIVPPREDQVNLARLIYVADELYRIAIGSAQMRRDEALAILARHMRNADARG